MTRTKNILFSLCALLLFVSRSLAQPPTPVKVYVFYTEDCPSCGGILQGYLPGLKSTYPFLEIQTFDIKDPSYYEALVRLEKHFGRSSSDLPAVFIGDQMFSGEQEVMNKLEPLILEYQMMGELIPKLPPIEIPSKPAVSEKTSSVDLAYFYQKGCQKCDRAGYLLKYLANKYPRLNVKEIDLNTADGKRLNETLSNRLRLPSEKRLIAPSIFVGEDCLSPEEITESRVEALIEKYGKMEAGSPLKIEEGEIKKADEAIVDRFKSFGVFAILLAGLVEGLNPCALATLVFFISYLTMIGQKRREIFLVGIGFSASSFVTHLLIGVGILRFIQHFSFFPLFTRIVYLITFIFSLFLGIFSIYDYIQLKKGRPSKMTLQVPDFFKKKIHRVIRTRTGGFETAREKQSVRFLLVSSLIGFVVTLLQSTCTSQVYLPTLLFVTNIPSLRGSAAFYLVLYNLVYILPLVAIFGIAYWGVSSERLSFILQKRVSTIKLFTAVFFLALAGVLILGFL